MVEYSVKEVRAMASDLRGAPGTSMLGSHISLPTVKAVAIYEALSAYADLLERIKADEEAPLDRRVGWMLESTSGKGWWTGREIWDFTHDPNEAAVFTQHVARWRESNFRGDAKATEHIWISNTHPPAQVQVCDYCQKAPAQPAEHVPEVRLWDTQWMNIVNHDNCYRDWSKEDAINHAVKMTEQAIARNIADGKLPPARAAAQKADQ